MITLCAFLFVRHSHGPLIHGQATLQSGHISKVLTKYEKPLTFYIVAIFGTGIFLWLLHTAKKFEINRKGRLATSVRFIAEGTFPIYVFHFPILVLIVAAVPYNRAGTWQKVSMLLFVTTVGILAGTPLNVLKRKLRSLASRKETLAQNAIESR